MGSNIKDVDEIIKLSESRHTPDKMAYQHIIHQGDKLIRARAIEQKTDAKFEIPAMILFKPYYDRDELARRVYLHYKRINFSCKLDKYMIRLSWGKNDSEEDSESESESDESESDESDESVDSDSDSDTDTKTKKKINIDKSSNLSKRASKFAK